MHRLAENYCRDSLHVDLAGQESTYLNMCEPLEKHYALIFNRLGCVKTVSEIHYGPRYASDRGTRCAPSRGPSCTPDQ